jgi:hypothetical protein
MKARSAVAIAAICVTLLAFPVSPRIASAAEVDYGAMEGLLPSTGEMSQWIDRLWSMGVHSRYGYRMPGTPQDMRAARYVRDRFEEFGLVDTHFEPVPASFSFPESWNLNVRAHGRNENIRSYFLRYAAFTPPQGIKAPLVYVGQGSAAEFDAAGDVNGKIVLVDIIAPPMPVAALAPATLYKYDPNNTLVGENAIENWPPTNFDSTYARAGQRGAAGYIAVITFMARDNNQYLHWYADGSLPGLSVSPEDGDHLKSLLTAGPVEASMKLHGRSGPGTVYNVYGTVPGRHYGTPADEFIVVHTHYDGWATNEASATSVVLALAKYFAQLPRESRHKSLLFVTMASHFGNKAAWQDYDNQAYVLAQQGKVKCAFVLEMIGKQYKIINGEYVATGMVSPRGVMVTIRKPTFPSPLIGIASAAVTKYQLDRTMVIAAFFGEASIWNTLGIPTVGHITHNAPQFSQGDTPETVMFDALRPTAAAFAEMIQAVDATF